MLRLDRPHEVPDGRCAGDVKGGSGGAAAEHISNASFAILTLIYTFQSLLDLSDAVSELAGVTARVAVLLQVPHADLRAQM